MSKNLPPTYSQVIFRTAGVHGRSGSSVFSSWFLFWSFFDRMIRKWMISDRILAEDITIESFLNIKFTERPGFNNNQFRNSSNSKQKNLYKQGITFWWNCTFQPSNPYVLRAHEGQLRLMRRVGSTLEQVQTALMGFVDEVPDKAAKCLDEFEYNSLIRWNAKEKRSVLFGVLSYVDHACDSTFSFNKEQNLEGTSFPKPPTCWTNKALRGVTLKFVDTKEDGTTIKLSKKRYESEQPFFCCYGDIWFTCKCNQCISNSA